MDVPQIGKRKGKQKETFETWSKPKQKGKVGTRANPSAEALSSLSRNPKKKQSTSNPKGMKSTGVSTAAVDDSAEVQKDLEDDSRHRRPAGGVQTASGIHSEVTLRGRQMKRVDGGINLPISEDAVVSDRFLKNGRAGTTADKGSSGHGGQRPGKEIAHSPSPYRERKWRSPSSEDTFSNVGGRGNENRDLSGDLSLDGGDSGEYGMCRGDRRRKSRPKNGQHMNVDRSCSSESRSPKRSYGEPRRVHRRNSRRREARGERGAHRRSRHGKKSSSPEFENYNSTGDETDSEERSRCIVSRARRRHNRKSPKTVNVISDDESSDSTADEFSRAHDYAHSKVNKAEGVSPENESTKRRRRRHREGERENERRQRERQGLKGHYLFVDFKGIPYGFGVGAWRQELNKLSGSLDPSIINICHQPEEAMATLRRRLKDNFEYSARVDHTYIRKLAGKCVTQRRSRMISQMKGGEGCPAGFDADIWRRLDRMRQDPRREALSERMKFANAARINKGRTGPRGEEGTRDELYKQLGREPHPEELAYEMNRPKGYSGSSSKKKQVRERHSFRSMDMKGGSSDEGPGLAKKGMEVQGVVTGVGPGDGDKTVVYDLTNIRKMEEELHQLRAQLTLGAGSSIPEAMQDAGPSNSMTVGEEVSNTANRHVKRIRRKTYGGGNEGSSEDLEQERRT